MTSTMTTYRTTHKHTLIPLAPLTTKRTRSVELLKDADTTNTPSTIMGQRPPSPSPTSMISGQQSTGAIDYDTPTSPSMAGRHVRRSSSRIQRWLEDQSHIAVRRTTGPTSFEEPAAPHPYLAYAQPSTPFQHKEQEDQGRGGSGSLDGDKARRVSANAFASQLPDSHSAPSTPRKSSTFRPTTHIFQGPSPLRNFQRAFGSRRSTASSSGGPGSPSPTPSSSPPRPCANISKVHSGGSTSSTIYPRNHSRTTTPDIASPPSRSHTPWKLKPPSVRGHSLYPSDVSQPRPSTSSSITQSSVTTYSRTSLETPVSPRKVNFGSSIRVQPSGAFNTTPSLWSLPANASHMNDPPESTKVIAHDAEKHAVRIPLALKGPAGNMSDVSSVLGVPKTRKKRKLIISGIPPNDEPRFEAVRQWCETFGELHHITRVANGDLHVDFRKVEVADTVCRLQARVYINGVGSVCLSWFTGKRP